MMYVIDGWNLFRFASRLFRRSSFSSTWQQAPQSLFPRSSSQQHLRPNVHRIPPPQLNSDPVSSFFCRSIFILKLFHSLFLLLASKLVIVRNRPVFISTWMIPIKPMDSCSEKPVLHRSV